VHVVISVRILSSGASVREDILRKVPTAKVEVMEIDLSSMSSVRKFVVNFNALNLQLNILM
jgi:WW domain-containing oxidoreductase